MGTEVYLALGYAAFLMLAAGGPRPDGAALTRAHRPLSHRWVRVRPPPRRLDLSRGTSISAHVGIDHERRLARYRREPTSATRAPRRPTAPIPTRAARSPGRSTRGRIRRRDGFTAGSPWRCMGLAAVILLRSRWFATTSRPSSRCSSRRLQLSSRSRPEPARHFVAPWLYGAPPQPARFSPNRSPYRLKLIARRGTTGYQTHRAHCSALVVKTT